MAVLRNFLRLAVYITSIVYGYHLLTLKGTGDRNLCLFEIDLRMFVRNAEMIVQKCFFLFCFF